MIAQLEHFLKYNAWANARAISSILTVPGENPKALDTLSHLLIA